MHAFLLFTVTYDFIHVNLKDLISVNLLWVAYPRCT